MRRRHLVLLIGGGLIALILFFGAGSYFGYFFYYVYRGTRNEIYAAETGQKVYKVYKTGKYEDARQALLMYVTVLETLQALEQKPNKYYLFDLALTYARLALLAEKFGDEVTRIRYMQLASEQFRLSNPDVTCKSSPWQGLRRTVESIDRMSDNSDSQMSQTTVDRMEQIDKFICGE